MSSQTSPAVLSRDSIFLGRASESKEEAIEFVGKQLVSLGAVDDSYIDAMKAREETVSTFLGNGVALPHGTLESKDSITGTAIVVAQYPDGVDWGAGTAHLVIGVAAVGDDHVAVLSQIADVLQDEDTSQQLWTSDDPQFVFDTLSGGGTDADDVEDDDDGAIEEEVTILNPSSLHARPAAQIVELAQGVDAQVTITKGAKKADAKSIMAVLALGAATGDVVTLSAEGPDAREAVDKVAAVMTATEE